MTEIERKYLVNQKLWKPSAEGTKIKQGYLADDPERTVRVRISDGSYYLTIKGKTKGISRTELEYEIPEKDATVLMKMIKNKPVKKIRYKETIDGRTWEIDVFEDDNEGLVVAEVELESESQKFEKPVWAEKEVSSDKRYYNLYLSKKPYKTW